MLIAYYKYEEGEKNMFYRVGTLLSINGLQGKVIGYIQYENPQDGNKGWTEYRIKSDGLELWLSCD